MLINTFLVEDCADIRDTLVEAMEEIAPCRFVAHANSESTARQWLHTHPDDWQLAIVDLLLADGSGFGVLRQCQQRRPEQKVVVLTGHSHESIVEKCLDLGADEVFDKSGELEDLVEYCRAHAASLLEVKATPPPPPAAWVVDSFPRTTDVSPSTRS
ncbi:response regulator [Polaromonas sp.]|uniref:response regulator n=1 Tax=Polaromonas sp. TaxID=1869339 RepID=UPI0037519594